MIRDCLKPCTTCTHWRALDHPTDDCPQLVAKWQARGNLNQNLHQNQNVQMISVEKRSEGPKIAIVTRGGARTGVDIATQGNQTKQYVRKSTGPMPAFNPQREKETYQSTQKKILEPHGKASTSSLPHPKDPTVPEKSSAQVSTLIEFLKSCVELMRDRTVLSTLYKMIDHCAKRRGTPVTQRMVNQVLRWKRTNEEFKFNAQIVEYDVDNVILDLGLDVDVLPK